MKKLILFLSALLLACFLFTSCSTSIMKRHYRKGYFVEHKKHKTNPEQIVKNPAVATPALSSPTVKEEVVLPLNENVIAQADPIQAKAPEDTKESKHIVKQAEPSEPIAKSSKAERKASKREIKTNSSRGIASAVKDPDAELVGAALSLMWIVIIIILAAYIIGLFAVADVGTAGWLHILGVIALVLLILWLLRVV